MLKVKLFDLKEDLKQVETDVNNFIEDKYNIEEYDIEDIIIQNNVIAVLYDDGE